MRQSQSSSSSVRLALLYIIVSDPIGPDQAPPRRDLRVSDPKVRDLSLSELQLAPSSVLLLRFESEQLNCVFIFRLLLLIILNAGGLATSMAAPLAPPILAQAVELPVPPAYGIPSLELQDQKLSDQGKAGGLPKWLKLGSE